MRAATLAAPTPVLSAKASQKAVRVLAPAKAARAARVSARVARSIKAEAVSADAEARSRREALVAAAALATSLSVAPEARAGIPSGFTPISDSIKGYAFLYPFGWQEVAVDGVDLVYKDTIEPLENVSLKIIPTKTEKITDLGSPEVVGKTLVESVLTTPSANPKILKTSSREAEGKTYYQVEFVADVGPVLKRHQLATVGISQGRLFLLTTGANERRWDKMKNKLEIVAKSFYNLY